jgi:VanZ family protein
MRGLFLFSIVIIIYGSLFPFDFQFENLAQNDRRAIFSTNIFGARIADILSNVLLFLPLGFAGSELISRNKNEQKYYFLLCFCSFILALGVQILQIYIPQRYPALYDVLWNMVGTFLGILTANLMARHYSHILKSDHKISLFILLMGWVFFLLTPFIFSFEKATLMANISSHLNIEKYKIENILMFTAIWIVFGKLLEEMIYIRKKLFFSLEAIFIIIIILKMFVFRNVIEPEIFTGGIIAILLLHSKLFLKINVYKLALIILLPMMFYNSLYPFEFIENPYKKFVWIPFGEIFTPDILQTLRTFSYKFFVYGAIIWCFYKSYPNAKWIIYILIAYAGLIEILQHFTLFRIGGLTEILIVILLYNFLPRETANFDLKTEDKSAIR